MEELLVEIILGNDIKKVNETKTWILYVIEEKLEAEDENESDGEWEYNIKVEKENEIKSEAENNVEREIGIEDCMEHENVLQIAGYEEFRAETQSDITLSKFRKQACNEEELSLHKPKIISRKGLLYRLSLSGDPVKNEMELSHK